MALAVRDGVREGRLIERPVSAGFLSGLATALARQFRPQESATPGVIFAELARSAGLSGIPPPQRYLELLKRYGSSAFVYAACHRKAADQAAIPLLVKRVRGGKEQEVPDTHPLRVLLDRVNDLFTFYDLVELNSLNLDLAGNDYWLVFGDARGVPNEIWPLRPDWVTVVPDPERFVAGYLVRPEGGDAHPFLPISRSESGTGVLHFRHANPWNLWYGQGSLSAAWTSVLTDEAATAYRYYFYQNSARPDGILSTEQKLVDHQVEQIREWWRAAFQGPAQGHRVAVLDKSLKYQAISVSPKDSDVHRDRELSRPDMLVAFGVSLAVLGVETGDVGRRDEQIRHYYRSTIKPACLKRCATLTELLAPRFGSDLEVCPDFSRIPELQQDEVTRSQVDQVYLSTGVLTINEVRQRQGRTPVAWGDKPLVPISFAPLGEGGFGPVGFGTTAPVRRAWHGWDAALDALESDDAALADALATGDRGVLWERLIERAARQETDFARAVAGALSATGDLLASALRRGLGADAAIGDALAAGRRMLASAAVASLPAVMDAAWLRALRLIRARRRTQQRAVGPTWPLFDIAIPELAAYLAARPLRYGDLVAASLAPDFRTLLAELANEGAGIEEMAQAVSDRFSVITAARARVIARTEVISASNLAADVAYQQSDVVASHEWLTARDERVRPEHAAADGQVQPLGTAFLVGGVSLRYPGDVDGPAGSVINCRCVALPVVDGPE